MSHYVLENCIACKYTDCVDVCPVDCFHEGPNFLVIDPEECIDCALCVTECPAEAIKQESDLKKNDYDLSRIWPKIKTKKSPLSDAEENNGKKNKLNILRK